MTTTARARTPHHWLFVLFSSLVLVGCGSSSGGGDTTSAPAFDNALAAQFQQSYADLVLANYTDALALATQLQTDIDTFVAAPSADGLETCKATWVFARQFYQQCEITRFYGGPIDDDDGPEGLMNAWPLEEAYIDYVQGGLNTPLISDATTLPTINATTIEALNESGQGPDPDPERNIATGWHAIEFLLWGQDLGAPGMGPGTRSHLDFVDAGGTAPNANEDRRRAYLVACADLLVQNLQGLVDEWSPSGAYRMAWDALSTSDALTRILIGVGTLAFGELRGERLVAARLAADQEEEHSCFSDTTHLDHLFDIVGLLNVWEGNYQSGTGTNDHNGVGLRDVAATVTGSHVEDISTSLANCITTSVTPLVVPFEVAITAGGGSPESEALIDREICLSDFADALAALAAAMGLDGVTNDQI